MSLCRRSQNLVKQKGEEVVKVVRSLDNRIDFLQLLVQPLAPVDRRDHRPSGCGSRRSGPSCHPEGGVGNRSSGHSHLHTRPTGLSTPVAHL